MKTRAASGRDAGSTQRPVASAVKSRSCFPTKRTRRRDRYPCSRPWAPLVRLDRGPTDRVAVSRRDAASPPRSEDHFPAGSGRGPEWTRAAGEACCERGTIDVTCGERSSNSRSEPGGFTARDAPSSLACLNGVRCQGLVPLNARHPFRALFVRHRSVCTPAHPRKIRLSPGS